MIFSNTVLLAEQVCVLDAREARSSYVKQIPGKKGVLRLDIDLHRGRDLAGSVIALRLDAFAAYSLRLVPNFDG